MFELIKIATLLLSLSIRSANVPIEPFDFETMFGAENSYGKAMFLYERENGKYYYSYDTGFASKYIKFTSYKKTAKRIDIQKLSVLYPVKDFSFGVSCGLKRWGEPVSLLTITWETDYLSAEYSVGNKRESFEGNLRYKIKVNDRVSIIPLVLIKKFDADTFWQTKVVLEIISF